MYDLISIYVLGRKEWFTIFASRRARRYGHRTTSRTVILSMIPRLRGCDCKKLRLAELHCCVRSVKLGRLRTGAYCPVLSMAPGVRDCVTGER